MKLAEGISSEPNQKHRLPIEGYDDCVMELVWKDTQSGWFASFSWGTWAVSGMRIVTSPNILSQWSNILPFGFSILTKSGQDPLTIDDFENSEAEFYILSAEEVLTIEATYG